MEHMKPTRPLAVLWTLLLSLFAACAEIPATHPLDPETPADQQASAVVTGRLVLPDGLYAFDDPRQDQT